MPSECVKKVGKWPPSPQFWGNKTSPASLFYPFWLPRIEVLVGWAGGLLRDFLYKLSEEISHRMKHPAFVKKAGRLGSGLSEDQVLCFLRLAAITNPPRLRASSRPRLTVVEASGTAAAVAIRFPAEMGRDSGRPPAAGGANSPLAES